MPVVSNSALPTYDIPGIEHRTFAGPEHGMKTMEVWGQTIVPGGATPVHRHRCEEAIVVLEGSGTCIIEGRETRFGPNSTLIIPSDAIHQIVNSGDRNMVIIAALAMSPVLVRDEKGEELKNPWQ